ncbi:MAG: hypothetical protein AB7Y46_04755 [Armatimonadota bacterium]
MGRSLSLTAVALSVAASMAAAAVPIERVPEEITSPEFAVWLPVQECTADAEIAVALGWQAPDDCTLLRITRAATRLERVTPQGVTEIARWSRGLPPGTEGRELTIRRRAGELIIGAGEMALLHCLTDEPLAGRAGAWADAGARIGQMEVQPLGDVRLDEDFFQVAEVPGRWETLAGAWEVGVYWDPLQARDNRPIGASWYQPGQGACLTATGYHFWDCYVQEATLRLPAGLAGLAFHVTGPEDFCAFEVGAGMGQIVQIRGGQRAVLARGSLKLRPQWWYRLRAEVSTGHVRCFVNEAQVAEADLSPTLTGRIGLCASDAPDARFDDVSVLPLHAVRLPRIGPASAAVEFRGGEWTIEDGSLVGRAAGGEVAALRAGDFDDCVVSARVSVTRNATAGVVAHHAFGDRALLLTLTASAAPTWQLHSVTGGRTTKLAGGPAPAAEGALELRIVDGEVECRLDGVRLHRVWACDIAPGRAGVYVGGGRARFSELVCRELSSEPRAIICLADGNNAAMPALEEKQFLRPIPHLWRSRGGSWQVRTTEAGPRIVARGRPGDSRAIARFHEITPGEPRLIVDAGHSPGAAVTLGICTGEEPGYEAEFSATRSGFRLLRRGQAVYESDQDDPGTCVPGEIRRDGDWIIVGGRRGGQMRTLYSWRDPEPLPDGYAEVTVTGEEVQFREIVLASNSALVCRFDRVEPDWQPASGTWTDHTGMACILWDYWMTGDAREDSALIWNRRVLPADLTVDVSASEYTDGFADGAHTHYPYHDVRIVIAGDPERPEAGYAFVAGADRGRRSLLLRNGIPVASSDDPRCRIVMGSHCNAPRAVRLRAQKSGGVLTLTFNGVQALRWEDPEPLGGGHVGLGCDGCRVNFRDCVIYLAPAAEAS